MDMSSMFDGAASFEQNLGEWYVTVDDASIGGADVPGIVGTILAQNAFLDGQDPVYGIGAGADSEHFAVVGENRLPWRPLTGPGLTSPTSRPPARSLRGRQQLGDCHGKRAGRAA